MRVYPVDFALDGETVDPRPVNNSLRSVVGRMNGLDRWAFSGVPSAVEKFALGVWGKPRRVTNVLTATVEVSGRTVYSGGQTTSPGAVLRQIAEDSGDPWVEDFETGDGVLHVQLVCQVDHPANVWSRLGVLVDGTWAALGAATAQHAEVSSETVRVAGVIPVGAGAHRAEVVALIFNRTFSDQTVTFNDRLLVIREAVR